MKNVIFSIFLSLLLFAYFKGATSLALQNQTDEKLELPPLVTLQPDVVSMLTFGYKDLYDDFLLQSLISHIIPSPGQGILPYEKFKSLALAVVTQKPRIEAIYTLACYTFAFRYKHPEQCRMVSKQALTVLKESFYVPMMQGYMELFLLENSKKAAVYYALASKHKQAPDYLPGFVQKLKQGLVDPKESRKLRPMLDKFIKQFP